jgi:hypothetical protein
MNKTSQKVTGDFRTVTTALEKILRPYEKNLVLASSASTGYSLSTRHVLPNKQTLFFAGFQPRKAYVSYYLMPVYMFPDLLVGISAELRKRMQGKSCFNFKNVDPVVFKELASLTQAGFERFKKEGYLK